MEKFERPKEDQNIETVRRGRVGRMNDTRQTKSTFENRSLAFAGKEKQRTHKSF